MNSVHEPGSRTMSKNLTQEKYRVEQGQKQVGRTECTAKSQPACPGRARPAPACRARPARLRPACRAPLPRMMPPAPHARVPAAPRARGLSFLAAPARAPSACPTCAQSPAPCRLVPCTPSQTSHLSHDTNFVS